MRTLQCFVGAIDVKILLIANYYVNGYIITAVKQAVSEIHRIITIIQMQTECTDMHCRFEKQ